MFTHTGVGTGLQPFQPQDTPGKVCTPHHGKLIADPLLQK